MNLHEVTEYMKEHYTKEQISLCVDILEEHLKEEIHPDQKELFQHNEDFLKSVIIELEAEGNGK